MPGYFDLPAPEGKRSPLDQSSPDLEQVKKNREVFRQIRRHADSRFEDFHETQSAALKPRGEGQGPGAFEYAVNPHLRDYRRLNQQALDYSRENPIFEDPESQLARRRADLASFWKELDNGTEVTGATPEQLAEAEVGAKERVAEVKKAAIDGFDAEAYRQEMRLKTISTAADSVAEAYSKPEPIPENMGHLPDAAVAERHLSARRAERLEGRQALAAELGTMFQDKGRLSAEDLSSFNERAGELGLDDKQLSKYANKLTVDARRTLADEMVTSAKQGNFTHDSMADFAKRGERYGLTSEDISRYAKSNALVPRAQSRDDSIAAQNAAFGERTDGRQIGSDLGNQLRTVKKIQRAGGNVSARVWDNAFQTGRDETGIESVEQKNLGKLRINDNLNSAVTLNEEAKAFANGR